METHIPITYVMNLKVLPLKWDGKIIPDYQIRNDGVVFHNGNMLTPTKINGRNYARIVIEGHRWTYRIDYMVAYTFLEKPEDAIRLIHKNGIIDDDRFSNLVWYRKSDVLKQYEQYAIIESDGSIKEEWRPCITEFNPSLELEVSNFGDVRDKNHKQINIYNAHGYRVFYYRDPNNANTTRIKSVHRAVAEAFIPNPNHYTMVNHLDGNKSNDVVFNLEWVDNGMNSEHAYREGLNRKEGYTTNQIINVCKLLVEKVPHVQIEALTGVDRKTISDVYRGRRWTDVSRKFIMPEKKWTPVMKQQISDMIISGMKGKEIYEKLNVPYDQSAISLYERIRRELKQTGKI